MASSQLLKIILFNMMSATEDVKSSTKRQIATIYVHLSTSYDALIIYRD